ncbi:MAG: hypothetical protein H0W62_08105 [Chitinophagales bacterium]|nr:hypothetical protein [Chitinophagales bacterium]
MKPFYCAIVFLMLTFCAKGQRYYPLVDSGAIWNREVRDCYYTGGFYSCECHGGKFFLDGDTLIQHVLYQQLKFQDLYYYSYTSDNPPLNYGYNYAHPITVLIGALREDSMKKVWLRLFTYPLDNCPINLPLNHDTLLYDFNIKIGDTLQWLNESPVVTNIDSVQILNGEWRNRISFTNTFINWIEGIGSLEGLLSPYEIYFECSSGLTCFRKNDELLYETLASSPFSLTSCDSILLTVEYPSPRNFIFTISPNPASTFLSIDFSSPDFSSAQLKIMNTIGQTLLSDKIESGTSLQIEAELFLIIYSSVNFG